MSHNFKNYPISSHRSHPEYASPVELETSVGCDYFHGVLQYMSEVLMEEDELENKPCMLQDCSALQVAEKSFYDVLVQYPPGPNDQHTSFLVEQNLTDHSTRKKIHYREGYDYSEEQRSNKKGANFAEESEETDMYDKVLLCPGMNLGLNTAPVETRNILEQNARSRESKPGRPRSKKQANIREMVDLQGLLTRCAQAVASYDTITANELLNQIRQHSSPSGDGDERMAHYFANALEARIAGTGTAFYTTLYGLKLSTTEMLKAYRSFVTACPFAKMSNLFANKSVGKVAKGATRLHIIDFGILYGFQWPCIIQSLSLRPGGPPKLRITGIDFPQPGFRPAERVEETGRRLDNYCKRFNVPFEYTAIAKNWDTIQLEDIKIDRDETLIVNCMYRLKTVPDETVLGTSPRDAVLNLIRRINPDMFMHGIANGKYNTPFFVIRFREALHRFSALFDMMEANAPREDEDRFRFEKEVLGRDAMNVIACEGTQRVERPETYKQWQVRNMRVGFRQLPMNQDIMKEVRTNLKSHYHKDFMVDEDSNWMLQGWRGRVIYAISCWVSSQN